MLYYTLITHLKSINLHISSLHVPTQVSSRCRHLPFPHSQPPHLSLLAHPLPHLPILAQFLMSSISSPKTKGPTKWQVHSRSKRRRRDSNPRALAGKLISSQSRYGLFDTSPNIYGNSGCCDTLYYAPTAVSKKSSTAMRSSMRPVLICSSSSVP